MAADMASAPIELPITYRPDIDGLRALAILAVLAFHAFPDWVQGGFVGVDVFFVISGFLITTLIAKAMAAGRFSLRQFYARRIRRIFPALALVALACLGAGWYLLLADEYAQLGKHVAATSAFGLNFVLWNEAGYFDRAGALKPLLHLWSLGVEEQFYIVWPLVLWLAFKARVRPLALTLVLVAASFGYGVWITNTNAVAAFYSPFTRFWELAIGCALAVAAPASTAPATVSGAIGNASAILGLVLVVAGIRFVRSDLPFPGWWALLPTVGTGLLIVAGPQAWINRHILSLRILVWVGLISYPLYLWHWPLLSFARIQSWEPLTASLRVELVLASVILATLTYLLIERPVRRGRGAVAIALLLAMAGVGAAGARTFTREGLPGRFPEALRPYGAYHFQAGLNARTTTCWLTADQPASAFAPECLDDTPEHAGRPLAVVWGDSHAARLWVGVNQSLGERYRLAQFTRDACAPMALPGQGPCQDGNRYVLDRIAASKPAIVILFAAWVRYAQEWVPQAAASRELLSTIASLRDLRVPRILVVGPAPKWDPDLPRLVYAIAVRDRAHRIPERLTRGLDPSYAMTDRTLKALLANEPVTYVSVRDLYCTADGCLTHVGGTGPDHLVTYDYGHFTPPGAIYVAKHLPLE